MYGLRSGLAHSGRAGHHAPSILEMLMCTHGKKRKKRELLDVKYQEFLEVSNWQMNFSNALQEFEVETTH